MSADANNAIGRRFFEAQDRMRGGPDPALCASTYVAHIASYPPMTFTDHQNFAKAFYGGFPDLQHVIEETFADDGTVAVRFSLRGTHTGSFMGIPATNKPIDVGAIVTLRISDGKVIEARGQFDQMGMMRQLGVIA